jgi:subtilase family serine protease
VHCAGGLLRGNFEPMISTPQRISGLLSGSGLLAATLLTVGGSSAAVVSSAAAGPIPLAQLVSNHAFLTPPTTADCIAQFGIACYAPFQFQKAYNLDPLYKQGFTGAGKTIVIVDSYGFSGIGQELKAFDNAFHLPPPPHFAILQPEGPIPPFNPTKRPVMVGWAQETTLDVEYSHAIAPDANILLVETPVAETIGVTGFPQIVAAENYVIDHHLGDVITQSFAAPEQTFPNAQSLLKLRSAYKNAADHGVTVLAASGDQGPSGPKTLTPQGFAATYFLRRVAEWPADDPLVTGVGGLQLFLNAKGAETQPDAVWNDTALFGSPAAGGGGRSSIFDRPWYQNGVASAVHSSRGFPDISMSAAVNGAALVYLNANAAQGAAGFYLIGGTSEASPEFAGIIAIADQMAGHGLGLINPALYAMEAAGAPGLVDVTAGTNTVTFPQSGATHTVNGFAARDGYDLSTGVGTVNAALFVPELVAAVR